MPTRDFTPTEVQKQQWWSRFDRPFLEPFLNLESLPANWRDCVVFQHDETDLYCCEGEVRGLQDWANGERKQAIAELTETDLSSTKRREFVPDDRVVAFGLKKKASLNGQVGSVQPAESEKEGRLAVRFDGSQNVVLVKRENLRHKLGPIGASVDELSTLAGSGAGEQQVAAALSRAAAALQRMHEKLSMQLKLARCAGERHAEKAKRVRTLQAAETDEEEQRRLAYRAERLQVNANMLASELRTGEQEVAAIFSLLPRLAPPPIAVAIADDEVELQQDSADLSLVLSRLTSAVRCYRAIWQLSYLFATKVLLVCATSVLDTPSWSPVAFAFTHDTASAFEMREFLIRSARRAYESNKQKTIAWAADKAYLSVGRVDVNGFAMERISFFKHVLYIAKHVKPVAEPAAGTAGHRPGFALVNLAVGGSEPFLFTKPLAKFVREKLAEPGSKLQAEWWMDDEVAASSRERWTRYCAENGLVKVPFYVPTLALLEQAREGKPPYLQAGWKSEAVTVKPADAGADCLRMLVSQLDGVAYDSKRKKAECQQLLATHGYSFVTVRVSDLTPGKVKMVPTVISAIQEFIHDQYKSMLNRDFEAAFAYPEWIRLTPAAVQPPVHMPLSLFWDPPHTLKNWMTSCRIAYRNSQRANAPPPAAVAAVSTPLRSDKLPLLAGAADAEAQLLAEEPPEGEGEEAGAGAGAAAPSADSLIVRVGRAVSRVIDRQEERVQAAKGDLREVPPRLLHPNSMNVGFHPQSVPIAARAFSLAVASDARTHGDTEAAEVIERLASWYLGCTARGYAPAVRWETADQAPACGAAVVGSIP